MAVLNFDLAEVTALPAEKIKVGKVWSAFPEIQQFTNKTRRTGFASESVSRLQRDFHSCLSTVTGSTFVPRRAGK